MIYLLLVVVIAAVMISVISLRSRMADDPAKSVKDFRRAIKALGSERKPTRRLP